MFQNAILVQLKDYVHSDRDFGHVSQPAQATSPQRIERETYRNVPEGLHRLIGQAVQGVHAQVQHVESVLVAKSPVRYLHDVVPGEVEVREVPQFAERVLVDGPDLVIREDNHGAVHDVVERPGRDAFYQVVRQVDVDHAGASPEPRRVDHRDDVLRQVDPVQQDHVVEGVRAYRAYVVVVQEQVADGQVGEHAARDRRDRVGLQVDEPEPGNGAEAPRFQYLQAYQPQPQLLQVREVADVALVQHGDGRVVNRDGLVRAHLPQVGRGDYHVARQSQAGGVDFLVVLYFDWVPHDHVHVGHVAPGKRRAREEDEEEQRKRVHLS